jgi:uncharacterized repeat protein (TIGR01451 family)
MPDQKVTFEIRVSNPGEAAVTNVVVVDNVPSEMEVLSAAASSGNLTIDGQKVSLEQDVLEANQTVTLTIQVRIKASVPVPYAIDNQACVTDPTQPSGMRCADARLLSVTELPATGFSIWSSLRLAVLTLVVFAGLVIGSRIRRRRNRGR